MAARFQNVILVNIYAPSGAERREREKFFASELPYLLQGIPTSLVMGRLQQRPLKCRRHRTYKLQSDTTRVNTWLRPNRYVGNGTWTGHIHTLYKSWGVKTRQNIHITQPEWPKTGCRNEISDVHWPLGSGAKNSTRSDPNVAWTQLLEDDNDFVGRQKLSETAAAKMGRLDQTNQTLSQHGPMVGKGRKNKHQKALHRRRN